jgi:Arc/MetJ family transcription regulator
MARVKRTSLNLDFDLVEEARRELGTNGTTDTVHRALEEVVRRAALKSLAQWRFDHLPPDWLEKLRESEHLPDDES